MINHWEYLFVSIHNLDLFIKMTFVLPLTNRKSMIDYLNKSMGSKPVDSFLIMQACIGQIDLGIHPDVIGVVEQTFFEEEPEDTVVGFGMQTVLLRFEHYFVDFMF